MTNANQATDTSEKLARVVFVLTLLGAAAFIGTVLVYVL
jgi:hypothetical protein